jgi:hypothetical protein
MFKKLFFVTVLFALLATAILPGSAASADAVKVKGFAYVSKITVLSVSPNVSFKFLGDITCDKMLTRYAVRGKAIAVFAYDVKNIGGGAACDKSKSRRGYVTIPGPLVPGVYTVYINPNDAGTKWQKKLTIVVPVIATATPAPKP